MRIVFIVLFISFACFILSGCESDFLSQRPYSQSDMWNCYKGYDWTAGEVHDELIGSWEWIYTESFWFPEDGRYTEDENTIVEFFSDSTLTVMVDDQVETTLNWKVVPGDGSLFRLEMEPESSVLLYGRILICGDILEFNHSYIDGIDNFFERTN